MIFQKTDLPPLTAVYSSLITDKQRKKIEIRQIKKLERAGLSPQEIEYKIKRIMDREDKDDSRHHPYARIQDIGCRVSRGVSHST